MRPPTRTTSDALFGGTLTLHQPARGEGYRVNVDAVLLAWFATESPGARRARRVVDLGSGVGAVGLALLYRGQAERVLFVERDEALAALARANVTANGWETRAAVVAADVEDASAFEDVPADLVVCNPPYVPPGRGRAPVVAAAARVGDLPVFAHAARHALGARGRACFVYPAVELATLLETLRAARLEPKRLCFVHATVDSPARVALVEALPAKRGGLVTSPPFVERENGAPSAPLRALLAPRGP